MRNKKCLDRTGFKHGSDFGRPGSGRAWLWPTSLKRPHSTFWLRLNAFWRLDLSESSVGTLALPHVHLPDGLGVEILLLNSVAAVLRRGPRGAPVFVAVGAVLGVGHGGQRGRGGDSGFQVVRHCGGGWCLL